MMLTFPQPALQTQVVDLGDDKSLVSYDLDLETGLSASRCGRPPF